MAETRSKANKRLLEEAEDPRIIKRLGEIHGKGNENLSSLDQRFIKSHALSNKVESAALKKAASATPRPKAKRATKTAVPKRPWPKAPVPKKPIPPRECIVCGDVQLPQAFPHQSTTAHCTHAIEVCIECMHSWIATQLESNGCDSITCPSCPQILQYAEVQTAASNETFTAYDMATMRKALGTSEEFAWCLNTACTSGQFYSNEDHYMQCDSCGYKQCLHHSVAWHSGETCEEYDNRKSAAIENERKSNQAVESLSKRCPGAKCGVPIEKRDGCDHMTCRKCRHEFCWQCFAAQSEIRRVGNTAHEKGCRYHSENLRPSYPFNMH